VNRKEQSDVECVWCAIECSTFGVTCGRQVSRRASIVVFVLGSPLATKANLLEISGSLLWPFLAILVALPMPRLASADAFVRPLWQIRLTSLADIV